MFVFCDIFDTVMRMNDYNICKFIPFNDSGERTVRIVNFVQETTIQNYERLKIEAVYKICIVTNGIGFFHTAGKIHEIKKGDVFFTFPAIPFAVESGKDFRFMYISFLGGKAYQMLDRLNITGNNFLFRNQSSLISLWNDAINTEDEFVDLAGEGVLTYSLSVIGGRSQKNSRVASGNAAALIKKYIDDNFSDTTLSAEKIGEELSYSKKYVSTAFKQQMKTRISEYINTIRIQHACTLIKQNFTCVKDVAYLCGYSDPAYFSRVFKERMGVSPKMYK